MNEAVKVIEVDDKIVEIHYDEGANSPRVEWDNDDKFCCFHRRYTLPNDTNYKQGDFNSWEEMEEQIKKDYDVLEILPIYMYDHSGITISTSHEYPFNDRWDSGKIGFIFITKEDARKSHMVKRISKKVKEQVHKNLLANVAVYGEYLSGQVYGYIIKNKETDEELESCWGFYGMEDVEKEAESVAKCIVIPPKPQVENKDQLQLSLDN